MPETPSEKNGMDAPLPLLHEPREEVDEDWFDRIRRAKSAREQGRRAREGKAPVSPMPSTIPLSSHPNTRP